MSMRVYGWDQNPAIDRFLYRCSDTSGEFSVLSGRAQEITGVDGRRAIHLLPPVEVLAELSARNSLMPFGRGPVGQYTEPPSLNYPIPALGDHRRAWMNSFMAG